MRGYVGRPPGTTTLTLGSPWAAGYPDPSQRYMPPGVTIVGGSPVPNDYELAKIYGYTPVTHGWIVGRKTEQEPGVSIEPLAGFGRASTLGEETVEAQLKLMNEQLKTLKWNRVCSAIGCSVGALALVVSIISISRRR